MSLEDLSQQYFLDLQASRAAPVSAEAEAQLTAPISNLVRGVALESSQGEWHLLRETQLAGVRPDFGVLEGGRFAGWIELKAPGTGVDPQQWTGRNARQWARLAELDNLILSDGTHARLFRSGEPSGALVTLPYEEAADLNAFAELLREFAGSRPRPIRSAPDLARRLAPLARNLRERIDTGLRDEVPALTRAYRVWTELIREDITTQQFADAVAQVITYGLVIATLDGKGDADTDGDGVVSLEEAHAALAGSHRVLAATLRPLIEIDGLRELLRSETGGLERLMGAADPVAISSRRDPRGDAWLWFYEEFLAAYDPVARAAAGVYYTPIPVVTAVTRLVETVLTREFGLPLGFGDQSVVTLDPAVGTGTFPLAVLDAAAERALDLRGPAGPKQVATGLADRLFGFEILPGPFAVAHLRVGERLRQLGAPLPAEGAHILLADTLDSPRRDEGGAQGALFGAAAVLASERRRARTIKREQQVVAIVGNPPYDRVPRAAGGWVTSGKLEDAGESHRPTEPLFEDVVAATQGRAGFAAVASLYNLYTFFWRWAIWKAFEHHGDGPAVVGFVTASSWLSGPGFVGLRDLASQVADEIWVLDLGGDNRAGEPEENVFAIETPVAICVLFRRGRAAPQSPAVVHYRRVRGSTAEKLEELSTITPPTPASDRWVINDQATDGAPFVPASEDLEWASMPTIGDLLPWAQPGCKLDRAWPVAPDQETLTRRWRAFLADRSPVRRSELFPDPSAGRKVTTRVGALPRLVDEPPDREAPPTARYAWKPFDEQWILEDRRLAKTESPSLWASRGPGQLFLVCPSIRLAIGAGPAAWPTRALPDHNCFKGSAGGRVFALYRDAEGNLPNVTRGLVSAIGDGMRQGAAEANDPSPADVFAYVTAVLSGPSYQSTFATQLRDGEPDLRIPLTADPGLWAEAVRLGVLFQELHVSGPGEHDGTIQWAEAVEALPSIRDVQFDAASHALTIGTGCVSGVTDHMWRFAVSGWPVIQRWIEHRTVEGRGRRSSELDAIRPTTWQDSWNDELLLLLRKLARLETLHDQQTGLLRRIIAGPVITSDRLPTPAPIEHRPPATATPGSPQQLGIDGA
ncbi:MAG: hypothetical protein JWM98_216 [Thermoleophilia bacterium]|nr:hypothetical protein [Thermoleophilia bacterium]